MSYQLTIPKIEGDPCPNCGTPVIADNIGPAASFLTCPKCGGHTLPSPTATKREAKS